MAQPPKFIVFKDSNGEARWRVEAANDRTTGSSDQGFRDKTDAERAIKDHIETVVAASGVSISLGTEFEPVIEFEGFEEPAEEPAPEEPYRDQTVDETAGETPAEESSDEG